MEVWVNDWSGRLTAALDVSATVGGTISVTPDAPAEAVGHRVRARVGLEIVTADVTTADEWTIVARESESSDRYPKSTWAVGTAVDLVLTAGQFDELVGQVADEENVAYTDVQNEFTEPQIFAGVITPLLRDANNEASISMPGDNTILVAVEYISIDTTDIINIDANNYLTLSGRTGVNITSIEGTIYLTAETGGVEIVGPAKAYSTLTVGSTLTVRQPGGTAGTDEVEISHDGSVATIRNRDTGGIRVRNAAGTRNLLTLTEASLSHPGPNGGTGNEVFGTGAGASVTTGTLNTLIGAGAGAAIIGTWRNTFIGNGAGGAVNTDENTYIGYNCGNAATGQGNTAIGSQASPSAGGVNNILFGRLASSVGNDNVIFGAFGTNSGIVAQRSIIFHVGTGTQMEPDVYFSGNSATVNNRPMSRLRNEWVVATDATRTTRLSIWAFSTTTAQEGIRVEGNSGGVRLGFFGGAAVAKPAATGSRGGNAALASLLTQLASLGLITDSTTA